jgi:hypothetical protein
MGAIMRTAIAVLLAVLALAACGRQAPAAKTASARSQPHPALTVKCGLTTCSHGRAGQPCSIAGYPGIIVQTSATALGCDPKPGSFSEQPATSPPPTPTAAAQPVSATCLMGWVNVPAGSGVAVSSKKFRLSAPVPDTADGYSLSNYEAMQVTVSAASQTESVSTLTVVWYGSSGAEIGSGTLDIGQVITAGQSLTFLYDESMGSDPNPPAGASTCSVVSYSS